MLYGGGRGPGCLGAKLVASVLRSKGEHRLAALSVHKPPSLTPRSASPVQPLEQGDPLHRESTRATGLCTAHSFVFAPSCHRMLVTPAQHQAHPSSSCKSCRGCFVSIPSTPALMEESPRACMAPPSPSSSPRACTSYSPPRQPRGRRPCPRPAMPRRPSSRRPSSPTPVATGTLSSASCARGLGGDV